jgi:hypothetical protein
MGVGAERHSEAATAGVRGTAADGSGPKVASRTAVNQEPVRETNPGPGYGTREPPAGNAGTTE